MLTCGGVVYPLLEELPECVECDDFSRFDLGFDDFLWLPEEDPGDDAAAAPLEAAVEREDDLVLDFPALELVCELL